MNPIIKHYQFEPVKLIAATERLRKYVEAQKTESQLTEDIKWILNSHLYYYQAKQEAERALIYDKEADITWKERAQELEERLKKVESL